MGERTNAQNAQYEFGDEDFDFVDFLINHIVSLECIAIKHGDDVFNEIGAVIEELFFEGGASLRKSYIERTLQEIMDVLPVPEDKKKNYVIPFDWEDDAKAYAFAALCCLMHMSWVIKADNKEETK